jgi:polyisoprenyl-phosphate glycosyltransferase
MGQRDPVLSVVVPMYNEDSVLPLLVPRLRGVLDQLGEPYEVVAVDDGSTDGTLDALRAGRAVWPELRVIQLRRNCGHQAALTAGLMRARGAYVVSIDADLQDPPETIPEMLERARDEKLDIVYGVRAARAADSVFKRLTAGGYYRVMRGLVGKHVPAQAGDFRLLSRVAIEALRELPEKAPVLRLVVPWLGFPSGEVRFEREERAAGRTKYPLSRMVGLAADSVTSFSAAPLRVATWLGLAGVVVCGILVVVAIVAFLNGATIAGWPSLYLAVLFLGAVQLLCLGLLGEYVARIYTAVQGRPAYFVAADSDAVEDDPAGGPRPPHVRRPDADSTVPMAESRR